MPTAPDPAMPDPATPGASFSFNVPTAPRPAAPPVAAPPPRAVPDLPQGIAAAVAVVLFDLLLLAVAHAVGHAMAFFIVSSVVKLVALVACALLQRRALAYGIGAGVLLVFLGYLVAMLHAMAM